MKLVRYGKAGSEKPGLIDSQGKIRDLSGHVSDIAGAVLAPTALKKLAKLDPASLPAVRGNPRIGPCVAGTGKFICIGLNYSDHAAETGATVPPEPIIFMKATSAIVGPNDDLLIPRGSKKTDWEVELGVVIGKTAKYVTRGRGAELCRRLLHRARLSASAPSRPSAPANGPRARAATRSARPARGW